MRNYKKKVDQIQFDEEQITYIEANWDKLDIITIARHIFKNNELTGHSAEAIRVKAYIVKRFGGGVKVSVPRPDKPVVVPSLGLNDAQKEFLRNNIGGVSVEEATAVLFPQKYQNSKVDVSDKEYLDVYTYIRSLNPDSIPKEDQLADEAEYRPPGSIARMVPRINLYITKGSTDENKRFLDPNNLKPQERKWVEALIGYAKTHRFVMLMNEYKKRVDRELAESSYVRWLYGKDDLLEEEVDSYISLVEEVVDAQKIRRSIEKLDEEHQRLMRGEDSESKIKGMTLIDSMNSLRDRLKESKTRTKALTSSLISSRADRMKSKQEKTASLLNLVELWKNEESRRKMLALAAKRQKLLAVEVERLSSMESLKAEIYGLDKDDITN